MLARVNHVRFSYAVAMVNVNNLRIVRGGVAENERLNSFCFVSVEEASGIVKLKANVCNSFLCCDVVVYVSASVTGSVKANGQHFSLCCVEAQIESASVTLNDTNSWNSCCSLTGYRCDRESCVKGSLLVAELLALVWAYF